jgi:putative ABC transport system permease protein
MLRHFDFVARNALRNRRRSILTVISVTVSLCLLGILIAMYHSLFSPDDTSPAQALRLIVHHRVSLAQSMPSSYKQKVAAVPGVKAITTWQWFGGTYKDNRDSKNFFARFGADPREFFQVRPDVDIPDDQRQAFIQLRTGAIASKALVDSMGWKLGDTVNLEGDIFPVNLELKLVGIYTDPEKDEVLIFNNEYLQESLTAGGAQRDTTGAFFILADSAEDVPRVARNIDALFDNSPAPTKSESEKDFALSFLAFLGNMKMFLAAISGAVMFTILLVSANTVAMTVRERVRETAILRTIGFTPVEIIGLVLGEAAVLSAVGGLLAWVTAGVLCTVSHNSEAPFRLPLFQLWMGAIVFGVAVVIGVISAALPAWLASRRSVVQSMRYSG